jgi:iron(III) transport system substrate-binding protein
MNLDSQTPRRVARRGRSRVLLSGLAIGSIAAAVGATAAPLASSAARHANTVPLVVYSAQGYDSAMTTAFTKATGIPVSLDDNSTGPLLTQIEASKNNPNWGVLWVDGATAFATLDTQGLLLKGYEPKASWNSLGTASVPKDKSYVPTGVTLVAALAYNSKVVKTPPTSWSDLTSSTWKGQVGMNDPSQSGPTFPFIAGVMNYLGGSNGVAKGEAFFSSLKANGLVVHPTNGPTLSALAAGQINLALVQSSAAIGAGFTDSAIKVKYLNPVTLLPSAIGIDAKVSKTEQAEAKRFAAFVLSAAGQKIMQTGDPTGDSLYYPVLKGVAPLSALPSLAGVKTQTINPYLWGPREAAINTWFDANIVG